MSRGEPSKPLSGLKIFRMWHASYPAVIEAVYEENPGLAERSFDEQMARFFATRATYSDTFARAMRGLGHEVMEVVYDLEAAQRAWLRDHGKTIAEEEWRQEILMAQIEAFRPDVLYIHAVNASPPGFAARVKAAFPFVRLAVGYAGLDVQDRFLPGIDLLMLGIPFLIDRFRQRGMEAHLVYHGFDGQILDAMPAPREGETRHDFTFAGSSGFGYHQFFTTRYWTLVELLVRSHMEGWINDSQGSMPATHAMDWTLVTTAAARARGEAVTKRSIEPVKTHVAIMMGSMPLEAEVMQEYGTYVVPPEQGAGIDPSLPLVPLCKLVPDKVHPPVFGTEMFDLLRRSDVTFNIHTDQTQGQSANMRLFESTGIGTCLLTDATPNIGELFEPDREVVTYASVDEAIEKAEYLRDHPDERRAIAEAGHARAMRDHTLAERCKQIDAILRAAVK